MCAAGRGHDEDNLLAVMQSLITTGVAAGYGYDQVGDPSGQMRLG